MSRRKESRQSQLAATAEVRLECFRALQRAREDVARAEESGADEAVVEAMLAVRRAEKSCRESAAVHRAAISADRVSRYQSIRSAIREAEGKLTDLRGETESAGAAKNAAEQAVRAAEHELSECRRRAQEVLEPLLANCLRQETESVQGVLDAAKVKLDERSSRSQDAQRALAVASKAVEALRRELSVLLESARTHLRRLGPGSLDEIRDAATSARDCGVDLISLDAALVELERSADCPACVCIWLWSDSGEVAATVVFDERRRWPGSVDPALFNEDDFRSRLEQVRRSSAA